MRGALNDKMEDIADKDLIALAADAMEKAYAPYSGFRVGAALVTSEGDVFTGCNVENASYGLTQCAERVAIFKAVSSGSRQIARIAIVSSSGAATYPCGACLQALNEFALNTIIVLADEQGAIKTFDLTELLPHSFGPDLLK